MASRVARIAAFLAVEALVAVLALLAVAWSAAALVVLVLPLSLARVALWLCRTRRAHHHVVTAWEWVVLVVALLPWRNLDGTERDWPAHLEAMVRWPS